MKVYGLAAVLALMLVTVGCSSKGRFVYTLGPSTNSVLGFREQATGEITALTSGFSTDSQPVFMVIHPSGIFAYVINFGGGNVSAFTRNTKGNLAQATDPSTGNLLGPFNVGVHPIAAALNPGGQFLYVLNQQTSVDPQTNLLFATISIFSVDNSTANLTALGSPVSTPEGANSLPVAITVSPNGKFLYVVDSGDATVAGFQIGANGGLTAVAGSPFSVGSNPSFAAIDPQAKFLYVTNPNTNQIFAFTLDANTGALSPLSGSPFAAGTSPVSLVLDSAGVLLVAANQGSNNISAYSINGSTGALSQLSGSPFSTGVAPASVTVDISNNFVYVADHGSNDITAFAIVGGTLKSIIGSPFSIPDTPTFITSR